MSPLYIFLGGAAGLLGLGWWMSRRTNVAKGSLEPFTPTDAPPGRVPIEPPFVLIGNSVGEGIARTLTQHGVTSRAVQGYSTTRMLQVAESIPEGRYRTAIVEGHLNDMRWPTERTIANLRSIYQNLRGKGMSVVAVTSTPWEGYREWTSERGQWRAAVNRWIMSGGDGLIDLAIDVRPLLEDPARPGRVRREWSAGDNLHLNRDGYRVMADAVWEQLQRS
jgi:lysophospholipase L1-like esterase